MNDEYTWHPVHSDTYQVSGTRRQAGAIGIPDNFQIELEASSSHEAYIKVRDASYNGGYEQINVIAIKMKCLQCGDCHVTVPPELWLDY